MTNPSDPTPPLPPNKPGPNPAGHPDGDDNAAIGTPQPVPPGSTLTSWSDVVRQMPESKAEDANLGELPPVKFDSVSDKDILRQLRDEGSSSIMAQDATVPEVKPVFPTGYIPNFSTEIPAATLTDFPGGELNLPEAQAVAEDDLLPPMESSIIEASPLPEVPAAEPLSAFMLPPEAFTPPAETAGLPKEVSAEPDGLQQNLSTDSAGEFILPPEVPAAEPLSVFTPPDIPAAEPLSMIFGRAEVPVAEPLSSTIFPTAESAQPTDNLTSLEDLIAPDEPLAPLDPPEKEPVLEPLAQSPEDVTQTPTFRDIADLAEDVTETPTLRPSTAVFDDSIERPQTAFFDQPMPPDPIDFDQARPGDSPDLVSPQPRPMTPAMMDLLDGDSDESIDMGVQLDSTEPQSAVAAFAMRPDEEPGQLLLNRPAEDDDAINPFAPPEEDDGLLLMPPSSKPKVPQSDSAWLDPTAIDADEDVLKAGADTSLKTPAAPTGVAPVDDDIWSASGGLGTSSSARQPEGSDALDLLGGSTGDSGVLAQNDDAVDMNFQHEPDPLTESSVLSRPDFLLPDSDEALLATEADALSRGVPADSDPGVDIGDLLASADNDPRTGVFGVQTPVDADDEVPLLEQSSSVNLNDSPLPKGPMPSDLVPGRGRPTRFDEDDEFDPTQSSEVDLGHGPMPRRTQDSGPLEAYRMPRKEAHEPGGSSIVSMEMPSKLSHNLLSETDIRPGGTSHGAKSSVGTITPPPAPSSAALRAAPAASSSIGAWIVGILVGLIAGAVGVVSLLFFDLVPADVAGILAPGANRLANKSMIRPPSTVSPADLQKEAAERGRMALDAGEFSKALDEFRKADVNQPDVQLGRGKATFMSYLRKMSQESKKLRDNDKDFREAKTLLEKALKEGVAKKDTTSAANALLWLGLLDESINKFSDAEKRYREGIEKFPPMREIFETALSRLAVMTNKVKPVADAPADKAADARPLDTRTLLLQGLVLTMLQGGGRPAMSPEAPAIPEAAVATWKAIALARAGDYKNAIAELRKGRDAHDKRRNRNPGRGSNPIHDPREELFLVMCDEISIYWDVLSKLQSLPGSTLAKGTSPANEIDLAIKRNSSAAPMADAKLVAALTAAKLDPADPAKAVTELVNARDQAKMLLDEQVKLVKAGEEKLKATEDKLVLAEEKLKTADDKIKLAEDKAKTAESKALAGETALASILKELRAGKLLPADGKPEPADIARATSEAVKAATKGDDKTLLADLTAAKNEAAKLKDELEKLKKAPPAGNEALVKVQAELDTLKKSMTNMVPADEAKKLREEIALLKKQPAGGKQPKDLLDLWLAVLADPTRKSEADGALADAESVLGAEAPAAVQAKALAVKAFALRNKSDYAAARAAFEDVTKHEGFAKDDPWAKAVVTAAARLSNASAFLQEPANTKVVAKPTDLVEEGLKAFPSDSPEYGKLIAKRSLLKLQAGDLKAAQEDAEAAVKAGAAAEGQLALAQVAEKQADWTKAEELYRQVAEKFKDTPAGIEAQKGISRVLIKILFSKPSGSGMAGPRSSNFILLLQAQDDAKAKLTELLQLADDLIAKNEPEGHLIKARVLAKTGDFKAARASLQAYITALSASKQLSAEQAADVKAVLDLLPTEKPSIAPPAIAPNPPVPVPNPMTPPATQPTKSVVLDPEEEIARKQLLAERKYSEGVSRYFAREFGAAESALNKAIEYSGEDARYFYFLGLTQMIQGKQSDAMKAFRRGSELERSNRPTAKDVDRSLERVQGPSRRLIEQNRP